MDSLVSHALSAETPFGYWQIGATAESRYDVPDQPMQGEMDPFFFLTKDKNFIPHEYPCRTAFAAERRGRRPPAAGSFAPHRVWLPFGSPRLDLSGFWFRPTVLATWARCIVRTGQGGPARLRLATCGGAVLFANGAEVGHMSPYVRNKETAAEFDIDLAPGDTELLVYFDDLAERDARYYIELDWVSGPDDAVAGIEAPAIAPEVEALLAAMHFDRPAYTGGEVAVTLPRTLPVPATARITVEGDFMSHESLTLTRALAPHADRLPIGDVAQLPGDFRHFTIDLEAEGFSASRVLGVEICDADRQGPPPPALQDRVAEALAHVAAHAEGDSVAALARLGIGLGDARTHAMIDAVLPTISDCWDCADFALVPLLWCRFGFPHLLSPDLRDRIDEAVLGYRYWMDEPGNDVQWYFSENHALLFHTACYLAGHFLPDSTFLRSGRRGRDQSAVGRTRVLAWLDHFEAWEMAEFNSAPYFPIDLKGLTALQALAPDADIRDRARRGILRLLDVVANSCHHGVLTAAQGRSYEHTLRAGRSLELSAIGRLVFGSGNYGARFHALPGLALCLRDHGLVLDPHLPARAIRMGPGEDEWCFAQGENRFAALYHARTSDWALGSAAAYRWFDWGYQETLIHARFGNEPMAQLWINHPGEVIHSGYGRPSYWGGSASVPRVQQYRGLALVWFDGVDGQPDFTHAWFPTPVFDSWHLSGDTALAVSGGGSILLRGSGTLAPVPDGPSAGCELRLAGRKNWWIVRMGRNDDPARLAERAHGLRPEGGVRDTVRIEDAEYGTVLFHADGTVEAEGRTLSPKDWTVQGHRTTLGHPRGEAPGE